MAPVSSSSSSSHIDLPPGFRFYPTDEELVVHYLCRKAASLPFPVPVIADVDLYKFDPWELPAHAIFLGVWKQVEVEKALFGEKEWYFFSPRDRKYPNGSRPNRAAGSGYWKATGTDKPIPAMPGGRIAGVKKALVFYKGKAPRGIKTNWIMHEYRLPSRSSSSSSFSSSIRKKGNLRLDDWVLCRIYKKVYGAQKAAVMKDLAAAESSSCVEEDSSVPASPPRGLDLMAIHSGANMEYMTSLRFPSQGPNVLGEPVPAGQSLVHKEITKEEEEQDPKLLFNQQNFLHHNNNNIRSINTSSTMNMNMNIGNNNNIRSINTSSTMNMNMNIGIAGMAGFEKATLHGSKYYNHHQHQQGSTTALGCLHLQNMPSLSHSAGSFLASLAAELL